MDKYLKVVNENNVVQIDDSYRNVELIQKISLSNWSKGSVDNPDDNKGSFWWARVLTKDIKENTCVFLANLGSTPCAMYILEGSIMPPSEAYPGDNSLVVFAFDVDHGVAKPLMAPPDNVVLYVFGSARDYTTSENSGIQIIDSGGKIVFSSQKKYLRIIDTHNNYYQPQTKPAEPTYRYIDDKKKIAVQTFSMPWFYTAQGEDKEGWTSHIYFHSHGNGYHIETVKWKGKQHYWALRETMGSGAAFVTAADVTGY